MNAGTCICGQFGCRRRTGHELAWSRNDDYFRLSAAERDEYRRRVLADRLDRLVGVA